MSGVEKLQSNLSALDETDLEQISGGADMGDMMNFNLMKQMINSFFNVFGDDIKSLEDQLKYSEVMKTLDTYDNKNFPFTYRCEAFARSWNKNNKSDFMTPEMAGAILGMDDRLVRAKIANLSEEELKKLF